MLKDVLDKMPTVFAPIILIQGQEYQHSGKVLNVRLSDGLLKSRVKGQGGQIYNIHIDLKNWPQESARCSCSVEINCKHAVACLLALQQQESATHDSDKQLPNKLLSTWINSLRENEQVFANASPTHEVLYLLQPEYNVYEPRMMVRLALAKRLKKGGLGKKVVFNTITPLRKQSFSAADEAIISALLFKCDASNWFERLPLRNSDLIEKMLLTNRAYLYDAENDTPLALGKPNAAHFSWSLALDGTQQLVLQGTNKQLKPLLLDRPWYYDDVRNAFGYLETSYPILQIKKILAVPPVSLDDAPLIAQSIAQSLPDIPAPHFYEKREIYRRQPTPTVIFDAIETDDARMLLTRELAFDYQRITISAATEPSRIVVYQNETLFVVERDIKFEKLIIKECDQILPIRKFFYTEQFLVDKSSTAAILENCENEKGFAYLRDVIKPQLEKKGWRVELKHPLFIPIIYADSQEWFSDLEEKGNDFFNYQLGILVDGKQVSIVPIVAELISKMRSSNIEEIEDDAELLLDLPEGKRLQITMARIKPLIRFLVHYGSEGLDQNKQLVISRYQFILMQETEQAIAATALRWQGGEKLRQHMQQLVGLQKLEEVTLPKNINAELRDYQYQGLNWLQFLRSVQFGGVLADDMGLGKTIQTLVNLQLEKEQGRLERASLIIAPTSLVGNWFEEAKKFTPELKVLIFHGTDRHTVSFDDYDVIVSTYGLIQRDKTRFMGYSFYYLILDEAQSIKNARAKTTLVIQQVNATHRLCLTGTPLENHLGELWSLFHFIMPGLLGSMKDFRKFFKLPIERDANKDRQELLAKRVKPFMLRRTKNQVAAELPPKTEMTQIIELAGPQRDLYEAIRLSMEKKVRDAITRLGIGKSQIILLDALLKLRQVCCDPRLLSIPEAQIAHNCSAKLEALVELLDNLMAENRRVLIFSQFTSMLKLIEQKLKLRDYSYIKLTGQTQNRQQLVNLFQEGNTPIFLISLKAGGTGLNLTKADTVIHYDPWWNPAVEDQATDRSHRIGQENPVFVYKFITAGTVEEAILAMQSKKRQLFDGILSENINATVGLTTQDIEQLFMPLSD